MKLGILVDDMNSKGGVPRSIANLANGLNRYLKWDIEVISCFKGIEKSIYYSLDQEIKLIYLNLDRDENINKILRQIKFYRRIRKKITNEKYDVVVSSSAFLSIYAQGISKKIKIIGCEHGAYSHLSSNWRKITQVVYRRLSALVLLTNEERECYKIKDSKIKVIKNMKSFNSEEKAELNNKKILSIGRIDENKNICNMIEVFKEVSTVVLDAKLKIIGNGDCGEIEKVKKIIKQLDLVGKVKIQEFTHDVKKEYLECGIFLMTSKSEGLPMVLVEAMTCGVPCISYDIKTGPKDLILDNETGYLIEAFDKKNMKEKIIELLENKEKRKEMGMKAYQKSSEFNEEVIIKEWEKLISEVVK
ncbi:MAG: glycosyltransferase family 4 protein [Clostridium sp.]|uniref:glycosyltransferase family 4 protein n=1 Tax=Clostridium sp. TaxID=1506 RepID=UPI003F2D9BEE